LDKELIGLLIASFIGATWIGYYAYLSWLKPDKFRRIAKKSLPLYGNSPGMKDWISARLFLWLARLATTITAVVCVLIFIQSAWSLLLMF
jgi:hypothetical protein